MSHIKKYKTGEITEILEGIYNNPVARRTVVPLFMSNPGRGKTHIIRDFMKSKGCDKPSFVLSQRMPFEVSGMALVDQKEQLMKYYDFDFFLNLKDGDIIFCDETFNANPVTLSAFLTFLEDRIMISGKKLPDIMIIAAANPQGKPVIHPQTNRRFLIYDIVFDPSYWKKYMLNKYKMPEIVSSKLCSLIASEEFKEYNYSTEADFDKAVHMIIQGIKTPYEDDLLPILETLVENKTKEQVKISEDRILEPGESISWLEMVRLSKNINNLENNFDLGGYSVVITHSVGYKINILKTIKELTGLGLKASKDIIDFEPHVVKSGLTKKEADEFKIKLEAAGAGVSIKKRTSEINSSDYEILMYNDKDEVIGKIKDIETLKNMYNFNEEDIKNINNGIKTIPRTFPTTYPPAGFIFKKINK